MLKLSWGCTTASSLRPKSPIRSDGPPRQRDNYTTGRPARDSTNSEINQYSLPCQCPLPPTELFPAALASRFNFTSSCRRRAHDVIPTEHLILRSEHHSRGTCAWYSKTVLSKCRRTRSRTVGVLAATRSSPENDPDASPASAMSGAAPGHGSVCKGALAEGPEMIQCLSKRTKTPNLATLQLHGIVTSYSNRPREAGSNLQHEEGWEAITPTHGPRAWWLANLEEGTGFYIFQRAWTLQERKNGALAEKPPRGWRTLWLSQETSKCLVACDESQPNQTSTESVLRSEFTCEQPLC